MEKRIELIKGDITELKVDAIINAANPSLLGGGGVDGAIHRVAGAGLQEVCRLLGGCEPGEAKLTKGFKLPADYIIHTVGPVWTGGERGEANLLASCYQNSLRLGAEHKCKILAFPNISTGIYHFPKEQAAEIAISETRDYLAQNPLPAKVIFVCYDDENFRIYEKLLQVIN